MENQMRKFLLLSFVAFPLFGSAEVFSGNTNYRVCFTPGENCTQEIVDEINRAQQSIEVQSYSFTSKPIALALVQAAKRSVKVRIIFDRSQFNCHHFSYASYFLRNNIRVWDDADLDIAHNKVMIFDNKIVETGSFNYTKAAQQYNAENVLIIENPSLANEYHQNWERRLALAKPITQDTCPTRDYY
jgi:phosphatidylserine/phosphatidylglycerophosphate/cardiolipin synthase-like enzyme